MSVIIIMRACLTSYSEETYGLDSDKVETMAMAHICSSTWDRRIEILVPKLREWVRSKRPRMTSYAPVWTD